MDDGVPMPKFETEHSTMFYIRANLVDGETITALNPHHRESKTPIKNVNGVIKYTLQPQFRAPITTGLVFSIPVKYHLRVTPYSQFSLASGITLLDGMQVFDNDFHGELKLTMINTSDTPVPISHGQIIGVGCFTKVIEYSLDETNRKVAAKEFLKAETEKPETEKPEEE